MKYLFVNPISFVFETAPIIGVPQLIAILKNENVESEFIDLNIKYFNELTTEQSILNIIKEFNNYFFNSDLSNLSNSILEIFKQNKIKYKSDLPKLIYIAKRIEFCVYILKDKHLFYNLPLCEYAYNMISTLSEIISQLWLDLLNDIVPDIFTLRSYTDIRNFNFDFKKLISFFEFSNNILFKFYEKEIDEILLKKPDCIGISINMESQFLPALYLCYLLKKRKINIHINIGGSFFKEFYKLINNINDFFGNFFDTISINDSCSSVLELLKFIKNEIKISEVSNLLYLDVNQLKRNNNISHTNINKLPIEMFDGYQLDNYISPEFVVPVVASVSCYYRKCIFCCCCQDDGYQVKSVVNFVNEIEYLSKKYNTKYFYFWDNSLSPAYLDKLSDILIEKNLKISYSVYARCEKEFTYNLLKKIKRSGCVKILWGLDTASERLLKYINKGVELSQVENVLKNAYKAGISSTLHIILGHPTETCYDMEDNIKFLKKNKKYIDLLHVAQSILFYENSIITNEIDKYKSLIYTTIEERKKYKIILENIARKNRTPFLICEVGSYNVLYLKKYGRKLFYLFELCYSKLVKNKFLFSFYIKIFIILYDLRGKNSKWNI